MSQPNASEEDIFTSNCTEFSELSRKIKTYTDELKKLRKRQKELKEPIKIFMKEHNSDEVDIEGAATIKYSENKRMKPVNKTSIQPSLINFFNEKMNEFNASSIEKKAEMISDWVYDKENREFGTTEIIKTV